MLFYASLFVFSIILSAVVLWLYRSVTAVGKTAYRAFLPSSRGNVRREKKVILSDSLSSAQTPWGWSSHSGPRRALPVAALDRPNGTVPWGWPGSEKSALGQANPRVGEHAKAESAANSTPGSIRNNRSKQDSSGNRSKEGRPMVGWPYRAESFEFAGRQYKVIRKQTKRKTKLGSVSKPWGW